MDRNAPFCRLRADRKCFALLPLLGYETVSQHMRQFPELQLLYVIDFGWFLPFPSLKKNWHSPCSISGSRFREMPGAAGEWALEKEG